MRIPRPGSHSSDFSKANAQCRQGRRRKNHRRDRNSCADDWRHGSLRPGRRSHGLFAWPLSAAAEALPGDGRAVVWWTLAGGQMSTLHESWRGLRRRGPALHCGRAQAPRAAAGGLDVAPSPEAPPPPIRPRARRGRAAAHRAHCGCAAAQPPARPEDLPGRAMQPCEGSRRGRWGRGQYTAHPCRLDPPALLGAGVPEPAGRCRACRRGRRGIPQEPMPSPGLCAARYPLPCPTTARTLTAPSAYTA